MFDDIEIILREECGIVRDRPIIVGVSGGPDSLCLMEVLRRAGYPLVVAHFNHQLRPEAEQDAGAVEKIASHLRLQWVVDGADVRSYAAKAGLSIEEAARNLRYRFMFNLAHQHHAQAVAVGHTADDQVETVLQHFLRGSGLAGLKGMSPRSIVKSFDPQIPVIRPLLNVWREQTVGYCSEHGLQPQYDSSNDSLEYQRNRVRHTLIPALESHNPKIREAILRMSKSLQGDHDLLMEILETGWRDSVIDLGEDSISFDLSRLLRTSTGLTRNLIKRAMLAIQPGLDVDFSTIERACKFIRDPQPRSQVDLKGGLRMFREMERIIVSKSNAKLQFPFWPQMDGSGPVPVSIPETVKLAAGWRFTSDAVPPTTDVRELAEKNGDEFQVWLDADSIHDKLELRSRSRGDRFEPLGMEDHSQKLSDFMVNEKMPGRARDRWPLLCSGGEIIWVPGYRPAHPYRLKESTQKVWHFSILPPGGLQVE